MKYKVIKTEIKCICRNSSTLTLTHEVKNKGCEAAKCSVPLKGGVLVMTDVLEGNKTIFFYILPE